MNDIFINFFENNFDYKKLKKSRLKRKLSLAEVSEMANIPPATLQRYEDGITKKIPLEAVKKLSSIYGTDYNAYYSWTTFPLFGSLSGLLISLFFGISIPIAHVGTVLGSILGILGMFGGKKIFENYSSKKENIKDIIYNSLDEIERKKYDDFLLISKTILKTDEIINSKEKKEIDNLLFTVFLMHYIRKNNKEEIIDFEEAEILKIEDNN